MRASRTSRVAALIIGTAMAAAACGGDDTAAPADTSATTTVPATTAAPTTTPTTEPPSGAIGSIDDAKQAVVQVVAQGSFRDPAYGTSGFAGTGSGFVIDPSGVVVTNNHVVTGAGAVKVYIGGSDEAVPARVLGVSECSDLAVLQLIDPGPYPYVEWASGDIQPPMDVFAAGFPLGDPEYTVTRGVVSKAEADGQTGWASVRHVVEHDANIQPGNSGGPLFDESGKVVAVNYAGGDPGTGTSQFYAISNTLAQPLVDQLQDGDVDSIGVNGSAFVSEDGSFAGVWVGGVAAGSPAAKAGVLPGDVITSLNGVQMATSPGTLEAYCDVLRSAAEGAALGIEVIRFDTEEVWAGELNGTPMAARFSFADDLGDEVDQTTDSYTYEDVTDDTGSITVSVPMEWAERSTAPIDLGFGTPSPAIVAAPSLDGYNSGYDVPGMYFFYVPAGVGAAPDDLLDQLADANCAEEAREDYDDSVFTGRRLIMSCPNGTLMVIVAGSPNFDPSQTVVVGVQAVTSADLEALDNIFYTFNIIA